MGAYPLVFEPMLYPKVWGGRYLEHLNKQMPSHDGPDATIGESWELADLPASTAHNGQSVIANGPLAGSTLHEAIVWNRHEIMGLASLSDEHGFPLFHDLHFTLP